MLTNSELYLLAWYRSLIPLKQLALRAWLNSGDVRLVLWLGFLAGDFHEIAQIATPESSEQLPLDR